MHVHLQRQDAAAVPGPRVSIAVGATPERGGAFVSSADTSRFSSRSPLHLLFPRDAHRLK